MASGPHVLIVGAGLGGLTLAQILRKKNMSFEIFDREENHNVRRQGWAVGIHGVMKELEELVSDDMPSIERTNHLLPLTLPAQIKFYGAGMPEKNLGVVSTPDNPILRASRNKLRTWLTTGLNIQFGKRAIRVEEDTDSATVYFEDGTSARGDLVIGADGVKSIVRSHLTDTTADHIPFQIIVGTITLQGEAAKRQFQLGHSAYMIDEFDDVGEHIRCFVGLDRIADDGQSADFYWLLHQRGEPVIDLDSQSILDIVKRKISRWEDGAWCKALSESTKESILQPPLAVRDIQLPDLPACRVTLLGDAAHAMAPFRGEGAVHAMRDAINLGRALVNISEPSREAILQIVGEYQDEMIPRGRQAVTASRNAFQDGKKNPQGIFAWGVQVTEQQESVIEFPISQTAV